MLRTMFPAVLAAARTAMLATRAAGAARRTSLGFHCTTKGRAAGAALVLTLALGAVLAAGGAAEARGVNTWLALFDLEPGVTYTYELTYETPARTPSPPWWVGYAPGGPGAGGHGPGGAGNNRTAALTGQLTLRRTGGPNDQVRFAFTVGDVRVSGAAPADPQAVAGAVLVAALTGPRPVSPEGVRLLATVFQWTQWRDLFERSTFRTGTVWEVQQQPPYRFTARQQGFFGTYKGEVQRGRDTVMEITIDLGQPLPLDIVAFDGRDRYRARLVQEPVWGPLR